MAVRRFKQARKSRQRRGTKPRTKVDKSLSRRIKRLEKAPEMKYHDYVNTTTPTNNGVAYSLVSNIDGGSDFNERVGNKIYAKKLLMQFRLDWQPSAIATQFRFIVGWDKQMNAGGSFGIFTGTSPTQSDLATALLDNVAGQISINSPYNERTKQRYVILYDRIFDHNPFDPTIEYVSHIKKVIQLHNTVINYNDDNIGLDTLPSRNLFVCYFDSFSTNAVNINANYRLFYTDP